MNATIAEQLTAVIQRAAPNTSYTDAVAAALAVIDWWTRFLTSNGKRDDP